MSFRQKLIKSIIKPFGLQAQYGRLYKAHIPGDRELYNGKQILPRIVGNEMIRNALFNESPLLVSRIGGCEMSLLFNYLFQAHRKTIRWNSRVVKEIHINAGMFSTDDSSLRKFANLYLELLPDINFLGILNSEGEELVTKKYCSKTTFLQLDSLSPFLYEEPWSQMLKNKKVLIVHPFRKSIHDQYSQHREKLFSNPKVLPEFEIQLIQSVQSIAGKKTNFLNWFDALEHMKGQINEVDFDIAIIGAGAYGLPLAHHVKMLGKKAVHIGGATQLLFGIKGGRWNDMPNVSSLYNSYWIRPTGDEVVANSELVENSCYW